MLNQIVLVGRVTKIEGRENNTYANITLAITRSYKNMDGEYETDMVPVVVKGGIAENALEYVTSGDLVGVKGRMETINDKLVIVCEKLTFLASKNNN